MCGLSGYSLGNTQNPHSAAAFFSCCYGGIGVTSAALFFDLVWGPFPVPPTSLSLSGVRPPLSRLIGALRQLLMHISPTKTSLLGKADWFFGVIIIFAVPDSSNAVMGLPPT